MALVRAVAVVACLEFAEPRHVCPKPARHSVCNAVQSLMVAAALWIVAHVRMDKSVEAVARAEYVLHNAFPRAVLH